MASTPIYGLRYQELGDPPDGPNLGKNLADDVEAVLDDIDTRLATAETDIDSLQVATGHLLDSGWTDVATVGVHWTNTLRVRLKDGICYMAGNVTKTGTASASGGTTIVTSLPANIRPAEDITVLGNMFINGTDNQRGTFMVRIFASGLMQAFITSESGSLANMGVLRFSAAYPVGA